MTIITLWQQGQSIRAISRATGRDRKTIKRAIEKYQTEAANAAAVVSVTSKQQKISAIEPYKDQVIDYLEQNLTGVRIFKGHLE